MDYKELLVKYFALVWSVEGTTFLSYVDELGFTPEERKALEEIKELALQLRKEAGL